MTLKVGSTVIKHVADYLRFQLHRAAEARLANTAQKDFCIM